MAEEREEKQRLFEEGEIWNFKECAECGRPDREDFIMRRVHERNFGCKNCRSPGMWPHGFIEPVQSRERISALIRAGRFNRYEAFA
jgi:recombinational DNA repair protein (RecF pathway)